MSIYDFTVTTEQGENYLMEKYRGHPLVIVNTATKCGLAGQFKGLEELYEQYQGQGLIVLGFPSNQFKQEVADSQAAAESCRMTYGVTFPMHQIREVNGPNALPLFAYLQETAPGTLGKKIKWNFTKFLVDQRGEVVERFAPQTDPRKMTAAIEKLL